MPLSDFRLKWPAQSALLAPLFPSTTLTGAFLKDVVTFPFENSFTQNFHPIPQFQSLVSVAEWQSGISSPDFLWVRTWATFLQQVFSRKAQIHLKLAPPETAYVFSPQPTSSENFPFSVQNVMIPLQQGLTAKTHA